MLGFSVAALKCMQVQLLTLALRSKLPLHLDIFDRTIKGSSRLPTGKDTSGPLFSLGIAIQQLQSCASTHLESSLERVQHQGWGTPRSCPASHKLTGLLHRCALSASDQLISAGTVSNLSRQRS